jgi:hypothetical protein
MVGLGLQRNDGSGRPSMTADIPEQAPHNTPAAVGRGVPKVPRGDGLGSAASYEGDDDVGGVSVEVLASPVVDGGGSGVGVTGGDLDVS